jgi:hypothetical protein
MNISADTLLVVALMMAVFAAVTTLGTSLILGVGFERLRNGLEILKKQSGFFSDAIYKLDVRTDTLEKQGVFFFQTIHGLEQKIAEQPAKAETPAEPKHIEAAPEVSSILVSTTEAMGTGAENLLTGASFSAPATGTLWAKSEKDESIYNLH